MSQPAKASEPVSDFQRPARPVDLSDTAVHGFALGALAKKLMQEKAFTEHGQDGLTLVHRQDLTAVLSVSAAGRTMEERLPPGSRMIMPISGRISVRGGTAEAVRLTAGEAAAFGPDAKAEIYAEEASAVLIIIGAQ